MVRTFVLFLTIKTSSLGAASDFVPSARNMATIGADWQ